MKKKFNIDNSKIKKLRDIVNSNSQFVYNEYHNKNGKNYWGIICSCMDWISVAINYLKNDKTKSNNIDVMSMDVYTYISAIDIVWESIIQLHRVIFDNDNIPFEKEKSIFSMNDIYKDDNEYFKQIRSVFGAHPVNLKDSKGSKWYASWPSNIRTSEQFDIVVFLYSNEMHKDDVIFGIYYDELNQFLIKRYNYIDNLISEIKRQFYEYNENFKKIEIHKSDNLLKQLYILKDESAKRLNNVYYNDTIAELIDLYENTIEEDNFKNLESKYKEELKNIISEIFENLQKMNLVDLQNDNILNPDYPRELSYEISKLHECLYDNNSHPLFQFYLEKINKFVKSNYKLYTDDNYKILLLKLKIILHYKLWNEEQ